MSKDSKIYIVGYEGLVDQVTVKKLEERGYINIYIWNSQRTRANQISKEVF